MKQYPEKDPLAFLDIPTEEEREEKKKKRQEDIEMALQDIAERRPGYLELQELVSAEFGGYTQAEKRDLYTSLALRFFTEPKLLELISSEIEIKHENEIDEKVKKCLIKILEKLKKTIHEGCVKGDLKIDIHNKTVLASWVDAMSERGNIPILVFEAWKDLWKNGKDVAKFVDYYYVLADIALDTSDLHVLKFILSLSQGFLNNLSDTEKFLLRDKILTGQVVIDDVKTLQKMIDADAVFSYIMNKFTSHGNTYVAEANENFNTAVSDGTFKNSIFYALLKDVRDDNSPSGEQRRNKMNAIFLSNAEQPDVDLTKFPFNLMFDQDRITSLRRRLNEYMVEKEGQGVRRIFVPKKGEYVRGFSSNFDERPDEVTNLLEDNKEKDCYVGRIFETLAVQFSDLNDEERVEIQKFVGVLKNKLMHEARYLVSPRGDKIIIEDETLRNTYGIETITFIPDTSVVDLKIAVQYRDGLTCWCRLDTKFTLRDFAQKENQLDVSVDASLEWHAIILQCLSEILHKEKTQTKKSVYETDAKTEVVTRRPHLRKLPAGKGFTPQQALFAFENYGIDLARFNQQRNLGKENGQFTFVSETVVSSDRGDTPVETVLRQVEGLLFISKTK